MYTCKQNNDYICNMIDRIKKIIEFENLNSAQFADKIGVQRSSISHILSGRHKPSLEFVQKVLHAFPSINTDWLLSGKGNMEGLNKPDSDSSNTRKQDELFNLSKMRPDEEKPTSSPVLSSNEQKNPIPPDNSEVERVIIFYKNGKFKEYSPE